MIPVLLTPGRESATISTRWMDALMVADPSVAHATGSEKYQARRRFITSALVYAELPDSVLSFLFALIDSVKPGRRGTARSLAALAAAAGVAVSTAHAACRHLAAAGYVRELRKVGDRRRNRAPAAPRGSGRHVELSGWQVERIREGLADGTLTGWELRVLLAVLDRRGEDGTGAACGLSRSALAALLSTSRARVSRAVATLGAADLLDVARAPGRRWILTPHHAPVYAHPRPPAVRSAMAHARRLAGVPRDPAAAINAECWRAERRAAGRYRPTPEQVARWAGKPNGDRAGKPNDAGTGSAAFSEVSDTKAAGRDVPPLRGSSSENAFMASSARHLASVSNLGDRQPFSTRPPEAPPVPPARRRTPPLLPEEHDALPGWFRDKLARHAPGVVPPGDPLFGLDGVDGLPAERRGIPPVGDGVPPEVGNPG